MYLFHHSCASIKLPNYNSVNFKNQQKTSSNAGDVRNYLQVVPKKVVKLSEQTDSVPLQSNTSENTGPVLSDFEKSALKEYEKVEDKSQNEQNDDLETPKIEKDIKISIENIDNVEKIEEETEETEETEEKLKKLKLKLVSKILHR